MKKFVWFFSSNFYYRNIVDGKLEKARANQKEFDGLIFDLKKLDGAVGTMLVARFAEVNQGMSASKARARTLLDHFGESLPASNTAQNLAKELLKFFADDF